MHSYSRRLNFLELNLYVDLRWITYSSHTTTKKKQSRVLQPNNGTRTLMGGAVVIPVIMEIHRLPGLVSDSRHDTDTTEPNAPGLINLQGKPKTIKQKRTAPFLSIHL